VDYSPLFTWTVESELIHSPLFTQREQWRPPRKKKKKKKKKKWKGKEADLRWKLGCGEEALPVAQRASVEGVVAGVGCWWRKKKSCRGERLGGALTIWGVRAVACDGDGGFKAGGDDVGGWTPRWREREAGSAGSRNRIREAGFLAVFGPKFLPRWSMKITSIYRWWKRNTSSLLLTNFSPWFDPKTLQPLLQRSNDELPSLCRKMAGQVGHFGAVSPPL